jgi:uncharacterized pyridoxal phosphate-containing UPF0001 family protein
VLVTTTAPPEKGQEAYEAGERDFGENRGQEWLEKKERLPRDIRWHLIGHLQTNKVKQVVGEIFLIHSLDRPELADAIEKTSANKGIAEVPCMSIGPLTEDQGRIRECFRKSYELLERLKQKFPQHGWEILSMGMSADYKMAIEEGSNMLRIGSLVFGKRNQ